MLRVSTLTGFNVVSGKPVTVTWNPSDHIGMTFSEQNQLVSESASSQSGARATLGRSAGKYYFEVQVVAFGTSGDWLAGLANASVALNNAFNTTGFRLLWRANNALWADAVNLGSPGALAVNDVVCVAYDATTRKCWMRKNNDAWFGGGDPSAGTSPSHTLGGTDAVYPIAKSDNSSGTTSYRLRAHQSRFLYSPPSGFLPWDS